MTRNIDAHPEGDGMDGAAHGHPGDHPEDFESYVRRELSAMRETLEEVGKRSEDADRRSQDHERTLYGHEDSRRRLSEPGLVQVVSELASAFKDVRAVAKAGWAMLGLVGFSTAVSLFSLFMGANSGGG